MTIVSISYPEKAREVKDGFRLKIVFSDTGNRAHDLVLQSSAGWDDKAEADYEWVLETFPTKASFQQARAERIQKSIRKWKKELARLLTTVEGFPREGKVQLDVQTRGGSIGMPNLHWELLEDVACWPEGFNFEAISVRRLYCSGVDFPMIPRPDELRILLVSVRDVAVGEVGYNVISRPLAQIVGMLRSEGVSVKLDVVARPTFGDFKRHLFRYKRGYYHSVHFDLHGGCISEEGVDRYVLLFSNILGSIEPIQAEEVMDVLVHRGVATATFNACESAKATPQAKSTNLAEMLIEKGVSAVIAMTHKVSETAAAIFMEDFYRKLLQHNLTLTEAAASARRQLRENSIRSGRFGLKLSIPDSAVPVLYQRSQADDFVDCPGRHIAKTVSFQSMLAFLFNSKATISDKSCPSNIIGRDREIQQVERRISFENQNLVPIIGPAGYGKTALINYLDWYWTQTSRISRTFRFDLSKQSQTTFADILAEIRRGLGLPRRACIDDIIKKLKISSTPKCLVVLDSCETISSKGVPVERHRLADDMDDARRIFKFLLRVRDETPNIVLLASRVSLKETMDIGMDELTISGLSTHASVALAKNANPSCRLLSTTSSQMLTFLEKCFELVDGNPALVIAISKSTAMSSYESGKNLYEDLLLGQFKIDGSLTERMEKLASAIREIPELSKRSSMRLIASFLRYIPDDLITIFHVYASSPELPKTWNTAKVLGIEMWKTLVMLDAFPHLNELRLFAQLTLLGAILMEETDKEHGAVQKLYWVHPIMSFSFAMGGENEEGQEERRRRDIAFMHYFYCVRVATAHAFTNSGILNPNDAPSSPQANKLFFNHLKACLLATKYEAMTEWTPDERHLTITLARGFFAYPTDIYLDDLLLKLFDKTVAIWNKSVYDGNVRDGEGFNFATIVAGVADRRLSYPESTAAIKMALEALEREALHIRKMIVAQQFWYSLRLLLALSYPGKESTRPAVKAILEETLCRDLNLGSVDFTKPEAILLKSTVLKIFTIWINIRIMTETPKKVMDDALTPENPFIQQVLTGTTLLESTFGNVNPLDIMKEVQDYTIANTLGFANLARPLSDFSFSDLVSSIIRQPLRDFFEFAFPHMKDLAHHKDNTLLAAVAKHQIARLIGYNEEANVHLENEIDNEHNYENDSSRLSALKYLLATSPGDRSTEHEDHLRLLRDAAHAIESTETPQFFEIPGDVRMPIAHVCKFHAQCALNLFLQLTHLEEGDDRDKEQEDMLDKATHAHMRRAIELLPKVEDEGLEFYCLNCILVGAVRRFAFSLTDMDFTFQCFELEHRMVYLSFKLNEPIFAFTNSQISGRRFYVLFTFAHMLQLREPERCEFDIKLFHGNRRQAFEKTRSLLLVYTYAFSFVPNLDRKFEDNPEIYAEAEAILFDRKRISLKNLEVKGDIANILEARFGEWRSKYGLDQPREIEDWADALTFYLCYIKTSPRDGKAPVVEACEEEE